MGNFFTHERFGRPQFLAGLLLLVFLVQCLWLTGIELRKSELSSVEFVRIQHGLQLWHGNATATSAPSTQPPLSSHPEALQPYPSVFDRDHSRLWYLIGSAPLLVWPGTPQVETFHYWGWLARVPYLAFGVLLGASLWYVARRLYGNAGGFIALVLYCFSPAIIRASALWFAPPEMGAAWGTFGAIFTAIAVAHTLYAPREVVLWNWRRIVLLGLSLTLAVGSQFSLVIVVPLALAFMLYLAPMRRSATLAIWGAACALALVLLFAAYGFRVSSFGGELAQARFFRHSWRSYAMSHTYTAVFEQFARDNPALLLLLPAALTIYFAWPRARYFGNTAPLLIGALFFLFSLGTPHYGGTGFLLAALPFLFVFVAGTVADLLETRQRTHVFSAIGGLLAANALWNLWELLQFLRG